MGEHCGCCDIWETRPEAITTIPRSSRKGFLFLGGTGKQPGWHVRDSPDLVPVAYMTSRLPRQVEITTTRHHCSSCEPHGRSLGLRLLCVRMPLCPGVEPCGVRGLSRTSKSQLAVRKYTNSIAERVVAPARSCLRHSGSGEPTVQATSSMTASRSLRDGLAAIAGRTVAACCVLAVKSVSDPERCSRSALRFAAVPCQARHSGPPSTPLRAYAPERGAKQGDGGRQRNRSRGTSPKHVWPTACPTSRNRQHLIGNMRVPAWSLLCR